MKKFIGALLATAALFAAVAVPAFAHGNTNATLYNRGTSTCVNYHAGAANGNHDDVYVYYGCGPG